MTMAKPKKARGKEAISLMTPEARAHLKPRKSPYWVIIGRYMSLGLLITPRSRLWVARTSKPRQQCNLGVPEEREFPARLHDREKTNRSPAGPGLDLS